MDQRPEVQIARGIRRERDARTIRTAASIAGFVLVLIVGAFAESAVRFSGGGAVLVLAIVAIVGGVVAGGLAEKRYRLS